MREEAGAIILRLTQEINTMSLDRFQAEVLATRAEYESFDGNPHGNGRGVITRDPQQLLSLSFETPISLS